MKTITITHAKLKRLLENPPIFKIARENIKQGDICKILWNKYCRRAQRRDSTCKSRYGIAHWDYKKGEEVLLFKWG